MENTLKNKGTVYLLHFSKPFKHAKHYLGFTFNLDKRLKDHGNGQGARLIEIILQNGLSFELVRTWEGDRNFERKLKKRKNSPALCPICRSLKLTCRSENA